MPDVPTLKEVGVNGSAIISYGLLAPAKTEVRIVARLRSALSDMMSDAAFTDRLFSLGYEVHPLIGDDYRDFIVRDLEKWRAVAKAGGIKIEN